MVIFTDMLDGLDDYKPMFEALEHLKYNKHEVILFHVFDSNLEQNLDFENRPYRFVDLESGDTLKLNPVEVQEAYMQTQLLLRHLLLQNRQLLHQLTLLLRAITSFQFTLGIRTSTFLLLRQLRRLTRQ